MEGDPIRKVASYDRLFDQSLTHQYNLSIRLNPDGLSFSVYSLPHKKYIALESFRFPATFQHSGSALATAVYLDHIARAIDEKPWLVSEFKHRLVICNSKTYTLVPDPLFDSEKKADYLRFVHTVQPEDIILAAKLQSIDSHLVFGINNKIFNELNNWFPDTRLVHHAAALLESILPVFKHAEPSDVVFVNVNKKLMDVLVLRDNSLHFINSFDWRASSDIVYFLLFVLDQHSLNPVKINVLLMGEIEEGDDNHQLIGKYVRNVDFLTRHEPFTKGYALELIATSRFYDLLNPALCE
jgi:hypothetical protein